MSSNNERIENDLVGKQNSYPKLADLSDDKINKNESDLKKKHSSNYSLTSYRQEIIKSYPNSELISTNKKKPNPNSLNEIKTVSNGINKNSVLKPKKNKNYLSYIRYKLKPKTSSSQTIEFRVTELESPRNKLNFNSFKNFTETK